METISTEEAASIVKSKVNSPLLVQFVEGTETTVFRAQFNIGWLHVKQFLNIVYKLEHRYSKENCSRDDG